MKPGRTVAISATKVLICSFCNLHGPSIWCNMARVQERQPEDLDVGRPAVLVEPLPCSHMGFSKFAHEGE